MFRYRLTIRLGTVLVILCLLVISIPGWAQGAAIPIQIGQNAFGELTAEANTARYAVTAAGGETATVQVLALSPDFAPHFRVVNPAGVEVLVVANPHALNSLSGSASFADTGTYVIEISGENGTLGQFALSLQPGASLPEPVELALNQPIHDLVDSQTPVRIYQFSTTSEAYILTLLSDSPDAGMLVSLFDEEVGKTIATNDASVNGIAYRLPLQERSYRLEVRADDADDVAFTLCFGTCENALLTATAESPAGTVAETPEVVAATCLVGSGTGGSINVRSGPGTQYAVLGNLAAGQALPVLGQLTGGGWYQVSVNGQIGWVAASVTRLEGECATLAVVAAPANAPLAPTQAPPPTQASSGSVPGSPSSLPDLTIVINRYELFEDGGGLAAIDWTVTNRGTAASNPVTVAYCFDTTCYRGMSIQGIAPGATWSSGTAIPYLLDLSKSTSEATIQIDPDNAIPESNEGNNTATRTTAIPHPSPDLTVRIDSFFIDGAGAAHIAYTMSNLGSAPNISPFILMLCIDLTCTTYNITENMAPGSSSSGTTIRNEWEADPLATFPKATVTIDSGGSITETDESNNVGTAYPQ